jgi:hypothetical protein
MNKPIILAVAVCALVFQSSVALATETPPFSINQEGDMNMSCGALSHEALEMRRIIETTQTVKNKADMTDRGITAAGALGSFIVGTVTGGVGIAAAGFLMTEANSEKEEKADTVQDIAEQRRSFMVGVYNAKGCYGPIEHVMQDTPSKDIAVASIETAAGAPTQPRYND